MRRARAHSTAGNSSLNTHTVRSFVTSASAHSTIQACCNALGVRSTVSGSAMTQRSLTSFRYRCRPTTTNPAPKLPKLASSAADHTTAVTSTILKRSLRQGTRSCRVISEFASVPADLFNEFTGGGIRRVCPTLQPVEDLPVLFAEQCHIGGFLSLR